MSQQQSGEKTEQPTAKRLRDARRKGQVARSQELVTTISLVTIIGYLFINASAIFAQMIALFDRAAFYASYDSGGGYGVSAIYDAMGTLAMILLPVIVIAIVAGIVANFIQIGALVSMDAIKPRLERLNPAAGAKRIFSRKQFVEILKTLAKIVVLALLLFVVIRDAVGSYVNSLECGLSCQTAITSLVLRQLLAFTAVAFILVAAADVAFQRISHTRSLMMTRDEIKREHKDVEGDPLIKGRRRQLAQELAAGDPAPTVRTATAIIVNPTHLAVALYHSTDKAPVPVVTAKGRNQKARYMVGLAERAGIPVFRNITLARSLYADARLYQPIPEDLYDAVAEVMAWVAANKDSLYSNARPHSVIDMDDLRRDEEADSS